MESAGEEVTFIDPHAKLFQHLDRLADIKAGMRPPPVNVEIDLSNRCSLGCEFCHFQWTHTRGPLAGKTPKPEGAVPGGDLMPKQLAFKIIDELAAYGVRSVTWTGGGEPTLHPEFDSVIRWADGKLEQGLYTHGGHVTAELAGLLKYACTFVYVSLDAADATSYRQAKGVDRFKGACEGIELLAEASGDCTIGVGFLVTHENYRDAVKAVALMESLGADYIQFRPTIRYDMEHPNRVDEDTAWLDDALEILDEASYLSDRVEVDLDRFRMYRDWHGHGYRTCFWSGMQTVVTPNGMVWACANKREHPDATLGDLSKESFADVWVRSRLEQVNEHCRVMCRGALPNIALNEMLGDRPHANFI